MTLRRPRERVFQVLTYEAVAFLIVSPLYLYLFDRPFTEGLAIMIVLICAEMTSGMAHDYGFDLVEAQLRPNADHRGLRLRLFHALSREFWVNLLCLPLVVWLSGLGWLAAIALNSGMAVFYFIYNFGFFRLYDWLRPARGFDHGLPEPG